MDRFPDSLWRKDAISVDVFCQEEGPEDVVIFEENRTGALGKKPREGGTNINIVPIHVVFATAIYQVELFHPIDAEIPEKIRSQKENVYKNQKK